jgi:3-dehydroquinate synthase
LLTAPAGEQHKNLQSVRRLYDALLAKGVDRATLVVALGGGVVGDMAGFVAATYMRGLPLVQAPTTLLAMVDASIGGKVGVDLPQGKNLVGAFKDPRAVFADVTTLETLPPAEMRNGMAEVIKAALVGDPPLLELVTPGDPEQLLSGDPARLETLIRRAAAVKVRIVEADRLERGVRAYLNLGHTFGHALEVVTDFGVRHGHAVALGLVAAARLSHRLGLCDAALVAEVERVVDALGPWGDPAGEALLPYSGAAPALWQAMQHDKKWRDGRARFVLLRAAGDPVVVEDVPQQAVFAVLEQMSEGFTQ